MYSYRDLHKNNNRILYKQIRVYTYLQNKNVYNDKKKKPRVQTSYKHLRYFIYLGINCVYIIFFTILLLLS